MDSKDERCASRQGHGKERRVGRCQFQPKTGNAGTETRKEKRTVLMMDQGLSTFCFEARSSGNGRNRKFSLMICGWEERMDYSMNYITGSLRWVIMTDGNDLRPSLHSSIDTSKKKNASISSKRVTICQLYPYMSFDLAAVSSS